jgi:hypothetical protein
MPRSEVKSGRPVKNSGRASHRLDQELTIPTWLIHYPRHRIGVEGDVGAALEDVEHLVCARDLVTKPGILEISVKDDGHAIVELGHELVRVFRDDRERVEFLTSRVGPDVVEAGEGKELVARGVDVVGRFAAWFRPPFEKAAGWHDAAIGGKQTAESGSLGEGFPCRR